MTEFKIRGLHTEKGSNYFIVHQDEKPDLEDHISITEERILNGLMSKWKTDDLPSKWKKRKGISVFVWGNDYYDLVDLTVYDEKLKN